MRIFTLVTLALLLSVTTSNIFAQNITVTWAGIDAGGYNGDGMAGYLTEISNPSDICMDAAQNLYFVDQANFLVRKVSAKTGVVTTIAGGGSFTDDGIPATDASLDSLSYMCIDAAGNIYISTVDQIRVINVFTGNINTIAGTGVAGFSGDGGAATAARLNSPKGLCIDASNNIYIVDQGNNRVRKIAAATGIISTIAGTGISGYYGDGGPATAAKLSFSNAICVSSVGDVYFSDQGSSASLSGNFIRKISAATGIISNFTGIPGGGYASGDGGPASAASVGWVYGLCFDGGCNNLYLCDVSCACRKINMSSGIINTVAGSDSEDGYNGDGFNSLLALFNWPHGLCVSAADDIYIADSYNNRFRRVIRLTNTPAFAYGKGQTIYPCPGTSLDVSSMLPITNLTAGEIETWSVLIAPSHGSLVGFPYAAASNGTDSIKTPAGLGYTAAASYTGADSFTVKVSNGTLSDIITIYAMVNPTGPLSIAASASGSLCTGQSVDYTGSIDAGIWTTSNTNASFDSSVSAGGSNTMLVNSVGLDTVYYIFSGACASAVVTINAVPATGTLSGPASICLGATGIFSVSVTGGEWYTQSSNATVGSVGALTGDIVGSTVGTDSVIYLVTNAAGCYAYVSAFVNVAPLPDPGVISGTNTEYAGNTTTLTNTVTGGIWSSSNPAISTVSGAGDVYGVAPGVDSIIYSVTNACGTANTYFSFTVSDATTGINSTSVGADKLVVMPNPARDNFTVTFSSPVDEQVTIVVTDITGAKLKTITGVTNQPIDASLHVAAGVYLLNAATVHGNMSGKILIE